MIDYFKILVSIIISLVILTALSMIFYIMYSLLIGASIDIDGIREIFGIAIFGAVLFAVPGSIFWLIALYVISGSGPLTLKNHAISVLVSTIICVFGFALMLSEFNGLLQFFEKLTILLFVAPVAIGSLVSFKYLFTKNVEIIKM